MRNPEDEAGAGFDSEDYRRKKRDKRSESTTLRRIEVVSGKKNVKFRR
jgi:hypothetical protein